MPRPSLPLVSSLYVSFTFYIFSLPFMSSRTLAQSLMVRFLYLLDVSFIGLFTLTII